ncbi:MAG: exodeoxyribonuclease III [Pseudomonadota bacterium]
MRVITWNVNGVRAVLGKGLKPWSIVPKCDVVCIQETKAQPDQLDADVVTPRNWHGFWHSAQKKGYSGVATFCRAQPDEVVEGLGDRRFDDEGRVLAVRFGELVVVNAYFPNSQDEGRRLDYKLAFCASVEELLRVWQSKGCEVLLVGDYNIAHQPMDLARPKQNEKNAGYLPEERAWFSHYLSLGYRDVFRERYPEREGAYTWWSYRGGARAKNVGWRLDYGTTTHALADRVADIIIHPDLEGSDHCPVRIELR